MKPLGKPQEKEEATLNPFQPPSASDRLALKSLEKFKTYSKRDLELKFGEPKVAGGATFLAAAVEVTSIAEVRKAFRKFMMAPGRMTARYNIAYFRVHDPLTNKTSEGSKDDGDHGAGKIIRHVLHSKNLKNIAVFLSENSDGSDVGANVSQVMEMAVNSALGKMMESIP